MNHSATGETQNASSRKIAGIDVPLRLFIDGKWIDASRGGKIDVENPSDNSLIATVADATVEDAIRAIDAAHTAAPAWAATPPRVRSTLLMRCYEKILANAEWLAELISLENGKALVDAKGEVAYAAEFFRWYAEEAVRINGEISVAPSGGNRIIVQYQPIGIAVLVTPWNFPAAMATRKIAPALAAGCTCVLKPAAETPLTALAIARLMQEASIPAGVVNLITTSQAGPVVSTMLHDSRVRKLSFTGSTGVGRILLREAAENVLHTSMELGGNAPFIVLDDADLEQALDGAMIAKMRNGGEACTAANRFYVQRGIYDAFVQGLAKRMGALRIGPGSEPATQCGPLINRAAVTRITRLVEDAVERGARIVTGGESLMRPGCYYPPTVLADVAPDSALVRGEIFGPVAPVIPFEDVDDAIAMSNDTEHGLAAYIFTSDLRLGLKLSERLESGMVALNRGLVSDTAAPFGGVKQSGLGREGAHHGLLEYTEARYIATAW